MTDRGLETKVEVGHDPYSWLSMLKDYTRPTDREIYETQQEAEHLKCGYSMLKGKPGSLRANVWVPHGQLIVINEELMMDMCREYVGGIKFD